MARRKRRVVYRYRRKRRRRRKSKTIPLATIGGLIASFREEVACVVAGDFAGAVNSLGNKFSDPSTAFMTFVPLIVGALVSKVVGGMLGVNARLGRAGVPWLRV